MKTKERSDLIVKSMHTLLISSRLGSNNITLRPCGEVSKKSRPGWRQMKTKERSDLIVKSMHTLNSKHLKFGKILN